MTHFFPAPENEYERMLSERVAGWDGPHDLEALTPELLRQIASREGCDFATALLHRRIVESEAHGPFLVGLQKPSSDVLQTGVRVVIVPGAFYKENPKTGADGRLVKDAARRIGLPVLIAPVASTGRLADNARTLNAWLPAQGDGPLVLASVSKGSSDVKAALRRPDAKDAFERVIGWVNLCGILNGTPMADWLLSPSLLARANRFVYRVRGQSLDFLEDLRRVPGCALESPLALPAHMPSVHLLGFPLRHHIRDGLARRCHARVERFGPNDGAILLADATRWPGQICPIWGADHCLRPRIDVRPLLSAILHRMALRGIAAAVNV